MRVHVSQFLTLALVLVTSLAAASPSTAAGGDGDGEVIAVRGETQITVAGAAGAVLRIDAGSTVRPEDVTVERLEGSYGFIGLFRDCAHGSGVGLCAQMTAYSFAAIDGVLGKGHVSVAGDGLSPRDYQLYGVTDGVMRLTIRGSGAGPRLSVKVRGVVEVSMDPIPASCSPPACDWFLHGTAEREIEAPAFVSSTAIAHAEGRLPTGLGNVGVASARACVHAEHEDPGLVAQLPCEGGISLVETGDFRMHTTSRVDAVGTTRFSFEGYALDATGKGIVEGWVLYVRKGIECSPTCHEAVA